MANVTRTAGISSKASEFSTSGDLSLLERPCIGVCGSRKASETALEISRLLAESATKAGFVVASGYAGGVDQQAHLGALRSGGATIAVLAEGIDRFSLRQILREHATPSNLLIVSQFADDAKWTVWRAMERNKTIVALSSAMFVVEAGDTGGTLDAGKETLRQGKPLFVLDYKNERATTKGNRLLLGQGARRVSSRREMRDALSQLQEGSLMGAGRLL